MTWVSQKDGPMVAEQQGSSGKSFFYEERERRIRAKRMLLKVSIFSIVMFFAGLTSGYIVIQSDGFWVNIEPPVAFFYSTAIILISSLTMNLALSAAKKGDGKQILTYLLITTVLGIGFMFSQFRGYSELIQKGNYLTAKIGQVKGQYGKDYTFSYQGKELIREDGKFYRPSDRKRENPLNDELNSTSNTASSFIYVLTGAHMAHLAGGLIYLLVIVVRTLRKRVGPDNLLGIQQCSTYWHFLDGLWIYLLLFFLFIN